MTEGITCYERDETLCEDQMCLRTGCRLRNERLSPSYPVTSGPYCARKSHVNSDWHVEREFDCINDLRCWFIIATVYEPDPSEMGYTDGAIGSAEQRAKDIAKALNGTRGVAQGAANHDTPIPLADHEEIGRKVLNQPWAIQSAIVTITAHCTALTDECPTGLVADLAGSISRSCLELADALSLPSTLRQCPICARRVASPCETLAIATSCPLSSTTRGTAT